MSSYEIVSKGIFPLWGGHMQQVPFFLSAVQSIAPVSDWHRYNYHDITCGSCAVSASLAFYGMSVSANDIAMRSYVPARVIFGTTVSNKVLLKKILAGDSSVPSGKIPARDLIQHHLHPDAADIFDKLYYAGVRYGLTEGEDFYYKYIGVRWALLHKTYMYYLKMPTFDLQQLSLQGPQWAKVVQALNDPLTAILKVCKMVDHLVHALTSIDHERPPQVMIGDCRENIKLVDWSRPSFVCINPPTSGNDRFINANKIVDALMLNAFQERTDDVAPADFWKNLLLQTAASVPPGHYIFNFAGDGAVTREEAHETIYPQIGTVIQECLYPTSSKDEKVAGLSLLKRA